MRKKHNWYYVPCRQNLSLCKTKNTAVICMREKNIIVMISFPRNLKFIKKNFINLWEIAKNQLYANYFFCRLNCRLRLLPPYAHIPMSLSEILIFLIKLFISYLRIEFYVVIHTKRYWIKSVTVSIMVRDWMTTNVLTTIEFSNLLLI